MTDKAYIATSSEYVDDRDKIEGVFTDENLCDMFVARQATRTNRMRKTVHSVDLGAEYLTGGLTGFRVQINRDGSFHSVQKHTVPSERRVYIVVHHSELSYLGIEPDENRWLDIYCWAWDAPRARDLAKIAHAEVTAAKAWGTEGLFEPEKNKETE